MNWNKLLERQVRKYIPDDKLSEDFLQPFLFAVNGSYEAYERDSELAERAFKISEEEFIEVNTKLRSELTLKKLSIDQLKDAIHELDIENLGAENDELLAIAGFLKAQIIKRKEAEVESLTLARRLSLLINNMQMGILVEDENRHIALTNDFFCEMFGIPAPPERLKGMDCSGSAEQSKMFFADPEHFVKRINELLADQRTVSNEELELIDGRYFERDYIPVFIDGIYKGHLWNYRDISARKQAEAKLKAGEELWQFALEGAGEGVWEYNFQTQEIFFSRQYKKMLGFKDDEFNNETEEWLKRIHPDDLPLVVLQEQEYLAGKITSHEREYRILHRNGNYIWILDRGMVVSFTPDGMPVRIVGTHADITERKLSEQALRIKEEKYRNIIANMNLGLLEVDNDEYIKYANQSFCDLSGFTIDELIGKQPSVLFAQGANMALIGKKNQLRAKGVSDAYEVIVKNKRGELKWWLISGAPRYNDSGELVGSIGIHLDITQQKELEIELNEARENAEQSAKAKETFLANMSHEIRTPMNAIMGMSRQLEKTILNAQQHFFLKTITTATDHLMVVINDILDISKIEAGKLDLEYIGFNMYDLLKHTLQVMQPKADEKGLSLNLNTPVNLAPVLLGDPHRLNQVLLNLASNAVKFTEHGSVTVSCTVLNNSCNEQNLRIDVKDTGIGMEQDFLCNLFEKFTQEEKTTARKYGGTGLGMAISKQLVKLMDGHMEVFSQKGKGTEIALVIPFEIGTSKDVPETRKTIVDSTILKGTRVLLVEDNEMNRLVASSVLEAFGVIITEAVNGEEAVKEVQSTNFDIVLMDMQMPVMNGLEATAIIRHQLKLNIPIIALTANAIKGESERCLAAGMNSFVSKPFDENDLVNTIAECLHKTITHEVDSTNKPLASGQLYSLAKLEKIAHGNTAFIHKMLYLFIEQMPKSADEIETAFNNGDNKAVRAIVHKIKPAIDNLDIAILQDVVINLEHLPDGDPDRASNKVLVTQLVHVIKTVSLQLELILKEAVIN